MNRWTWTEVSFQLLRPIDLSSLRLHLTMTHSSTFSGLRFALFGVTVFPAAENTRSDFELAAGKWGDRYMWFFAFKIFSLPVPTRPGTRTFLQVPDPSRPEVKNLYPSDPAHRTESQKITKSNIEKFPLFLLGNVLNAGLKSCSPSSVQMLNLHVIHHMCTASMYIWTVQCGGRPLLFEIGNLSGWQYSHVFSPIS